MTIINKTKRTADIYNRGREVVKVYDHGKLAWQKQSSIPDYLCFTALESGTFTLTIPAAVTPTYLSYIEWSKNGRTWNHTDNTSEAVTIDVQVAQGDKVYWRGSGNCMTAVNAGDTYASKFSSTCRFDASGNITSLLLGVNYVTALVNYSTSGVRNVTFANLFLDCTTIVNAKDLLIPTFTSYYTYICYNMFYGCTNLISSPTLPSLELATACYYGTFRDCTSLTASAILPATALQESCYRYMYYNCTNLETVNPILATTASGTNCMNQMFRVCKKITRVELHLTGVLTQSCCYQMFQLCSALSYVKCLATDTSATNCVTNWLHNVSSTGTFIQASGVTWPRGASGIPTGWLAYDEGEEIPNDYTPCDYIYNRSTGGGGVDLGFKFRLLDYSVEAKFKQDEINNGMVCGTNANDSGAIWYYNYTGRGSFRVYACYSRTWQYDKEGFTPIDTDIHTIRYVGDADGCYQISDGTQSTSTNLSTWAADESTNNLFIFGRAVSSNTYKGRIYYLWVKDNSTNEYICNLFPCSRNSDGAAGFWDTAQKKFFTSTYWTAHFDNE